MGLATSPLDLQELIEHCIAFLPDSPSNLRACALVSRSWVYGAQSRIFRDIDFTSGQKNEADATWSRLHQTLDGSPHLIHHVRRLHITSGVLSDVALSTVCSFPFTQLVYAEILYPVRMPGSVQTAIEELLSRPTLRRLRIEANFPEFSQIWGRCSPSIRHMELSCFRSSRLDVDPIPPRRFPHTPLESLRLGSCSLIDDRLLHDMCPLDMSHLKALSLSHMNGGVLRWPKFTSALGTIEVLDLGFAAYGNVIDLSALTSLTIIRLRVPASGWKLVLDTLSTITAPKCIRRIVFHTCFMERIGCGRLDTILDSLPMHTLFTLDLEMDSIGAAWPAKQYFPQLTSRKMVRIVPHERNWFENFVGL
ncbi:hypothetical protein FB451DRAFT_1567222 [Mycena latifolia]|nr:hypothetical protein FB451DRAFT_1567222 [Mycena latifolia]